MDKTLNRRRWNRMAIRWDFAGSFRLICRSSCASSTFFQRCRRSEQNLLYFN